MLGIATSIEAFGILTFYNILIEIQKKNLTWTEYVNSCRKGTSFIYKLSLKLALIKLLNVFTKEKNIDFLNFFEITVYSLLTMGLFRNTINFIKK